MITSYLFWAAVVVAGILAGVFVRPRTVAMLVAGIFVCSLIGLLVSLVMKADTMAWTFGIVGTIVPLVTIAAYIVGAVVQSMIKGEVSDRIVRQVKEEADK